MKTCFVLLCLLGLPILCHAGDVVQVYVLAGQSNREGKVQSKLMENQSNHPKSRDLFAHPRNKEGWVIRDDVLIKFLDKHGDLTQGYGSGDRAGVELEFGWQIGDPHDDPVLLIKTAWGRHSLYRLFRSPSAAFPSDEFLAAELKKAKSKLTGSNEKKNRTDPLPTMESIKEG